MVWFLQLFHGGSPAASQTAMGNYEMRKLTTFRAKHIGSRLLSSGRSRKFALRRRSADGFGGCPHQHNRISRSGAGFTLLELMIAIMVLGILVLIGIQASKRPREQALVASCISFHVALQRSLYAEYAKNGEYPNTLDDILAYYAQLEANDFALSTEFNYVGGEDANAGHGNDWDGGDKDNPGNKKNLDEGEAGYYLRCNHNHSYIGVVFVDSGAYIPPKPIYDESQARGSI
jgi:prepilin-type N-terminal cleavage/methylation domain-containing protein